VNTWLYCILPLVHFREVGPEDFYQEYYWLGY